MKKSLIIEITEEDDVFSVNTDIDEYSTLEIIGLLAMLKAEYIQELLGTNPVDFNPN
jgi:hypothetical protein